MNTLTHTAAVRRRKARSSRRPLSAAARTSLTVTLAAIGTIGAVVYQVAPSAAALAAMLCGVAAVALVFTTPAAKGGEL